MSKPITFISTEHTTKWSILSTLWNNNSVEFNMDEDGWRIREELGKEIFSLRRDYITNHRFTDIDLFGLLGISLIDLKDKHVYITEGVSDFFTAKMCLQGNVLGVTQLGGSKIAKKVLVSLFESITIIADKDVTGLSNAMRWKSFLTSYGIEVKVWQPSIGKDITDEFLFNYKQGNEVQF